jgi:hypothetical protein
MSTYISGIQQIMGRTPQKVTNVSFKKNKESTEGFVGTILF